MTSSAAAALIPLLGIVTFLLATLLVFTASAILFGRPHTPDIEKRLQDSVRKACESQEYRDFMANRGFGVRWAEPAEFVRRILSADEQMGTAMKAVGLSR